MSTRDLFDRLGDNGINATTYYQRYTAARYALLSEILSGTKTSVCKRYPDTSKMYVFGNMVTRKDITSEKNQCAEATNRHVNRINVDAWCR